MADAALISALEELTDRLRGARGVRPRRARLLRRASTSAASARCSPPRRAAPRSRPRRAHGAAGGGAAAHLRGAPAGVDDLTGVENTRDVAAKFRLDGPDRRGGRGRAPGRGLRGEARPTHADLDLGSRQASPPGWASSPRACRPATAGRTSSCPSASSTCCGRSPPTCATATACSRLGLRALRGAHAGAEGAVRGESGTSKTMAAQVLAAELGLEIFRVDLATIVSKYIGETEKNLDRIFGAADGSNAILFFDEADALFGKRSEISDSTAATRTSRSRTCCRRWRATRARSSWRPTTAQHRRPFHVPRWTS